MKKTLQKDNDQQQKCNNQCNLNPNGNNQDGMDSRGNNQSGMALAVVVIIVAIIAILAYAILSRAQSEVQQTVNKEKYNQAYYLADSAARVLAKDIEGKIYRVGEIFSDSDDPNVPIPPSHQSEFKDLMEDLIDYIIPTNDGSAYTRNATVTVGTDTFNVAITKETIPVSPTSNFRLVLAATASSPDGSATATSIMKTKIFRPIIGIHSISDSQDAIRTPGNVILPNSNRIPGLKGNVTAGGHVEVRNFILDGNVTAGGNIYQEHPNGKINGVPPGTVRAGGVIRKGSILSHTNNLVDPGFISGVVPEENASLSSSVATEIITPEMVWRETHGWNGNLASGSWNMSHIGSLLNGIPVGRYSDASGLLSVNNRRLYADDSGYYPGNGGNDGSDDRTIIIDLSMGSVVLVFDRYYQPNSKQTKYVVTNSSSDSAKRYKHNFYIFIKEAYDHNDGTLTQINNSSSFFYVESNSNILFENDTAVYPSDPSNPAFQIKTYFIILNDGAQQWIYDNNAAPDDLYQSSIDNGTPGWPTFIPPERFISPSDLYSLSDDYFDTITFGNGQNLPIHIFAPLCRLKISNNGTVYGSVRAASFESDGNNFSIEYRPIDSDAINEALNPNLYFIARFLSIPSDNIWVRR